MIASDAVAYNVVAYNTIASNTIACVIMTVIGFISGSIMYSYFIPKFFFKVDVRNFSDDRNPGSANAIRAVGWKVGTVCMLLDVLKAFLPVFIAVNTLGVRGGYLVPVAVAPVAGHAFSPFLKFRGGKSVSTFFGSLFGLITLTWFAFVPAIILFVFKFIIVIKPDSSGVITGMAVMVLLAFLLGFAIFIKITAVLLALIIGGKHIAHPDKGEQSVGCGHFVVKYKDNRVMIARI